MHDHTYILINKLMTYLTQEFTLITVYTITFGIPNYIREYTSSGEFKNIQ